MAAKASPRSSTRDWLIFLVRATLIIDSFWAVGFLVGLLRRDIVVTAALAAAFLLAFTWGMLDRATRRRLSIGFTTAAIAGSMIGQSTTSHFPGPEMQDHRGALIAGTALCAVAGLAFFCVVIRDWRYMVPCVEIEGESAASAGEA